MSIRRYQTQVDKFWLVDPGLYPFCDMDGQFVVAFAHSLCF